MLASGVQFPLLLTWGLNPRIWLGKPDLCLYKPFGLMMAFLKFQGFYVKWPWMGFGVHVQLEWE